MNVKKTAAIVAICMLLVTILSAVLVYAPPPDDAKNVAELAKLIKEDTENIWNLPGNSHSWTDMQDAMDNVKDEISSIEDEVVNNINPQLDEIDNILNKLDVEALYYETLADPGNANPVQVCVSVAFFDGQPVLGLTKGNFVVYKLAGESPSVPWQVEVDDVHYNGFIHTLLVKPKTDYGNVWGSGPYIFAVEVTQGAYSGRTVTTVTVDGEDQGNGVEVLEGETTTLEGQAWTYILESYVPTTPKRITLYANLNNMQDGMTIQFSKNMDMTPGGQYCLEDYLTFTGVQFPGSIKIICDKLTVAKQFNVQVVQIGGEPITIKWHAIIEDT